VGGGGVFSSMLSARLLMDGVSLERVRLPMGRPGLRFVIWPGMGGKISKREAGILSSVYAEPRLTEEVSEVSFCEAGSS
jgi:hypothetical protein